MEKYLLTHISTVDIINNLVSEILEKREREFQGNIISGMLELRVYALGALGA